jgi:hypothetical protein
MSKPVKRRPKEHVMVKNVSRVILRMDCADARPCRRWTGKAPRSQRRCMCHSRRKYMRRAHASPTAEVPTAEVATPHEPTTAYVASASAHVAAATVLRQCNRSLNAGQSQR